jgi:hypothetical protein
VFVGLVATTFLLMIVVFYIYDWFVERRNTHLIENAARSNAVVSSLFPGKLREQVLDYKKQQKGGSGTTCGVTTTRSQRKHLLENNDFESMAKISTGEKPLADLYLETTVLFADIVGYTAWSSVREPSQVFTLLETVYSTFDELAKTRRVRSVIAMLLSPAFPTIKWIMRFACVVLPLTAAVCFGASSMLWKYIWDLTRANWVFA